MTKEEENAKVRVRSWVAFYISLFLKNPTDLRLLGSVHGAINVAFSIGAVKVDSYIRISNNADNIHLKTIGAK